MRYAIYMRVAHGEPAIDAYDRCAMQRNTLMEYVRENGLYVVEKYYDVGFSGNNMERPGLKKMIEDHAAGKFDGVLVVDMGRLAREPMEFPFPVVTVNGMTPSVQAVIDMRRKLAEEANYMGNPKPKGPFKNHLDKIKNE